MGETDDRAEIAALRAQIERLTGELQGLSARLARLESVREVETPYIGLPERDIPRPVEEPEQVIAPPVAPPAPKRATVSWEALIGGQGALWIGSVAVFLALAFGLAYTWTLIPPLLRVLGGFVLALGFLGASHVSRARAQRWFADGLAGAGLALAYLDAWAGYAHHGLFGPQVEFVLMALTTAAGAALALRYDAPAIGVLATLGGFGTPYVADGAAATTWPLYGYVGVLDGFVLAVSLFKRWHGLAWLGLAGTVLLAGGTAWHPDEGPSGFYPAAYAIPIACYFTVYFAEFVTAAVAYGLRRREAATPHDVLMLVAAAGIYGAATYTMLEGVLGPARAAFPLALALACGAIALAARRLAPENGVLRDTAIGLALFFLTIAFPIQLDTGWLAVAWVAEGALLEALGVAFTSRLLLGWGHAAELLALVTVCVLVQGAPPDAGVAALNDRVLPLAVSLVASTFLVGWGRRPAGLPLWGHAAWLVLGTTWLAGVELCAALAPAGLAGLADTAAGGAIAVTGLVLYVLGRGWGGTPLRVAGASLVVMGNLAIAIGPQEPVTAVMAGASLALAAIAIAALLFAPRFRPEAAGSRERAALDRVPALASLLGVWACTQAVHHWGTLGLFGLGDPTANALALTGVWLLFGLGLMALGMTLARQDLRRIALGLFALTAAKVLLFDLATLPTPWRILASGGLGVVLIGISWLYGRGTRTARPTDEPPAASD